MIVPESKSDAKVHPTSTCYARKNLTLQVMTTDSLLTVQTPPPLLLGPSRVPCFVTSYLSAVQAVALSSMHHMALTTTDASGSARQA